MLQSGSNVNKKMPIRGLECAFVGPYLNLHESEISAFSLIFMQYSGDMIFHYISHHQLGDMMTNP